MKSETARKTYLRLNKKIDLAGKDFAKGMYSVNVYDKDQLVSSTNFSLK